MNRITYPQSCYLVVTYTGAVTDPRLVMRPPRGPTVTAQQAGLTDRGGNVFAYLLTSPMVGSWMATYYGTVGGIAVATPPFKFRVEAGA